MNFIEKLIMVFIWIGMIIMTAYLFSKETLLGVAGIIVMVVFYFAWGLSNDFAIAPRNWWDMPNFEVFKKKLGWTVGIAGAAGFLFALFTGAI